MENTLETLLLMLQQSRNHIEMCIRTAAIKQNKKSNINASRPHGLCVKTNGICVIVNNMLVTPSAWTTEVMGERPLDVQYSGYPVVASNYNIILHNHLLGERNFCHVLLTLSSRMLNTVSSFDDSLL